MLLDSYAATLCPISFYSVPNTLAPAVALHILPVADRGSHLAARSDTPAAAAADDCTLLAVRQSLAAAVVGRNRLVAARQSLAVAVVRHKRLVAARNLDVEVAERKHLAVVHSRQVAGHGPAAAPDRIARRERRGLERQRGGWGRARLAHRKSGRYRRG